MAITIPISEISLGDITSNGHLDILAGNYGTETDQIYQFSKSSFSINDVSTLS